MLLKYNEYTNKINEGLFRNFIGKILRNVSDYISSPLNDFTKNISKSGDAKKIINSLKTYTQITGKSINKKLKTINTESDLKKLLKDTLLGLYTALKGVQATQKVNKTYFDEIFKNSDKNLIKTMSNNDKKINQSIDNYIDKILIPNLIKISGDKNESFIFENQDENQDENQNGKKISKNLKKVTYNWLNNLLSPILASRPPKQNNNYYTTSDGYKIKRQNVQNMIKQSNFKNIKRFRDSLKPMDGKNPKNEWPIQR